MASPLRTPTPKSGKPLPASKATIVESWTIEQTANVLSTMTVSDPAVASSSAPLAIPLDATPAPAPTSTPQHLRFRPGPGPDRLPQGAHTVHRRSTPIRRDSLARRELVLKGKEGSRRRQRWENDRLLHVPGAVPPSPGDWDVPCWPRREEYRPAPYWVAPLWEGRYRERIQQEPERAKLSGEEELAERVAKELKSRMKKARGAKGLLQDLEAEVRDFLVQIGKRNANHDGDSSDDEIVFVGRNGETSDGKKEAERMERLVFQSLEKDHGASFGRWLVHSIANYYGLETWSVTTGDPARREAYVGVKPGIEGNSLSGLPRPLWVLV